MSRIKNARLHTVKLKLAARQGSIGFVPIDTPERGWVIVPCFYCRVWLSLNKITIEHLTNKRDGGCNHQENLVLACTECNQRRNKQEQRREMHAS